MCNWVGTDGRLLINATITPANWLLTDGGAADAVYAKRLSSLPHPWFRASASGFVIPNSSSQPGRFEIDYPRQRWITSNNYPIKCRRLRGAGDFGWHFLSDSLLNIETRSIIESVFQCCPLPEYNLTHQQTVVEKMTGLKQFSDPEGAKRFSSMSGRKTGQSSASFLPSKVRSSSTVPASNNEEPLKNEINPGRIQNGWFPPDKRWRWDLGIAAREMGFNHRSSMASKRKYCPSLNRWETLREPALKRLTAAGRRWPEGGRGEGEGGRGGRREPSHAGNVTQPSAINSHLAASHIIDWCRATLPNKEI